MVAKPKEQQFVQCFQISMEDLQTMIKEAVKSVIPKLEFDQKNSCQPKTIGLDSNNDFLSRKEVTEILKVSYVTLWKYNKEGTLKVKNKIGRRVYYSRKDLNNLLNNVA